MSRRANKTKRMTKRKTLADHARANFVFAEPLSSISDDSDNSDEISHCSGAEDGLVHVTTPLVEGNTTLEQTQPLQLDSKQSAELQEMKDARQVSLTVGNYLALLQIFFTLVLHASLRSISKVDDDDDDNALAIFGTVFGGIGWILSLIFAYLNLHELAPALCAHTLWFTALTFVVELAWMVLAWDILALGWSADLRLLLWILISPTIVSNMYQNTGWAEKKAERKGILKVKGGIGAEEMV